jgi:hypothetical protein
MSQRRGAAAAAGKPAPAPFVGKKKPSSAAQRRRQAGPKATKKAQARARTAAATAKRVEGLLAATAAKLREGLFKDGFFSMELPHGFRFTPLTARLASHHVREDCATVTIFQKDAKTDGECNDGDGKREMAVLTEAYVQRAQARAAVSKQLLVRKVSDFLKRLVRLAFGAHYVASTESLLLSSPADGGGKSEDQSLHTDGKTTAAEAIAHAKRITKDLPPSFSALVSFQGATVSIVRGSHRVVREMSEDKSVTPCQPMHSEAVALPANHALFFTQDLIHAGDGYAEYNLRYHIYFDHKDVPREEDVTNPLRTLFGKKRAAMFMRA